MGVIMPCPSKATVASPSTKVYLIINLTNQLSWSVVLLAALPQSVIPSEERSGIYLRRCLAAF